MQAFITGNVLTFAINRTISINNTRRNKNLSALIRKTIPIY